MKLKIGVQCQYLPDDCAEELKSQSSIRDVLLTNPPPSAAAPKGLEDKRIFGRGWPGSDNWVNETFVAQGATGAKPYVDMMWERYYSQCPYVHYWSSPNEPHPMYNWYFYQQMLAFLPAFNTEMHNRGLKTFGPNTSNGWPDYPQTAAVVKASKDFDIKAVHNYVAPTLRGGVDEKDTLFRYRVFAEEYKRQFGVYPRLVVTETGVDHGSQGGITPGHGWKLTPNYSKWQYFLDAKWLNEQYNLDEYLESGLLYEFGATPDWATFEYDAEFIRWVGEYGRSLQPVTDTRHLPSTDARTVAATQLGELQDLCRWWLEEYVRAKESGDISRAEAILYQLINRESGLMYRAEAAAKGV